VRSSGASFETSEKQCFSDVSKLAPLDLTRDVRPRGLIQMPSKTPLTQRPRSFDVELSARLFALFSTVRRVFARPQLFPCSYSRQLLVPLRIASPTFRNWRRWTSPETYGLEG
jgi:hypothetical protein